MGKKFACFISVRAPFGNWGFMIIRCQVWKFVLRVCLRFIWICISVCLWEVLRALHMWRLWVLFMRVYKLVCGSWQILWQTSLSMYYIFKSSRLKVHGAAQGRQNFEDFDNLWLMLDWSNFDSLLIAAQSIIKRWFSITACLIRNHESCNLILIS